MQLIGVSQVAPFVCCSARLRTRDKPDAGEALAYHALGRPQDSDDALARLIAKHSNDSAYQIAQVYAYRGQVDAAFHWLGRAYAQHDEGLLWFKTDLKLKPLRNDPRYAQLLKKMNLRE